MDHLWTPWRMPYLRGDEPLPEGCLFCLAPQSDDAEVHILHRGSLCYVILNRYPYNNGHLLIAPERHVGDVEQLTVDEMTAIMTDTVRAQKVLTNVAHPHGFNWGLNVGRAAGAGLVDHLHMHIVPRWNGDTNFMPVFADVKVIPQALEDMCALLRAEAEKVK